MFDLFDTSRFQSRGCCGQFTPVEVGAWGTVSVGLWVVYWLVAADRLWTWHRSRGTDYPRGWNLPIAAFFVGCGGGHLMNALAFVWPAYSAFIAWDWLTAVASILGLIGLRRIDEWKMRRLSRAEVDLARAHAVAKDLEERIRVLAEAEMKMRLSARLLSPIDAGGSHVVG